MRPIECGLPGALLVTVRVARAIALLAGRNRSSKLRSVPWASVPLNADHWKTEPEAAAGNESWTAAPVWFPIVSVRVATVPRGTDPKVTTSGRKSRVPAGLGSGSGGGNPPGPLPISPTECGLPGAVLVTVRVARAIALLAGRNRSSKLRSSRLARVPLNADHWKTEPGGEAENDTLMVCPAEFCILNVLVWADPNGTEPKLTTVGLKFSPGNRSTLLELTQAPESPSPRRVPSSGLGRTLRP
jgi:hypothetical protein